MKYFWSYFTVFLLFIIQTTLGKYIDILGIAPNLVFVFAVCYSMYNFPVRSAVLCAISGLMLDIYNCSLIGVNALLFMYTGLLISLFASSLMKKSFWAVALGVIVISLIYQTVYFTVYSMTFGFSSYLYTFLRIVVPAAVYDGLTALIISLWAHWLSEEHIRGL